MGAPEAPFASGDVAHVSGRNQKGSGECTYLADLFDPPSMLPKDQRLVMSYTSRTPARQVRGMTRSRVHGRTALIRPPALQAPSPCGQARALGTSQAVRWVRSLPNRQRKGKTRLNLPPAFKGGSVHKIQLA